MKTTILTAILLIGCNTSAPADTLEECNEQLTIERELSENCADDFDRCESGLLMGDGERVDLEPTNTIDVREITDNEPTDEQRLIASLQAEIARITAAKNDEIELLKAQLDGEHVERRKLECKMGNLTREYNLHKTLCELNDFGVWMEVDLEVCE